MIFVTFKLNSYFQSQSFFFPVSICWHSVLHDAHQTHPQSTISVSVAWFRLISLWKVFRWRSHVFGRAVTPLLAHLTGKRLTSNRQSADCLAVWSVCQGPAWNMACFPVCKAGCSPKRKLWETEVKTLPKTEMPTRLILLTSIVEVCTAYSSICLQVCV